MATATKALIAILALAAIGAGVALATGGDSSAPPAPSNAAVRAVAAMSTDELVSQRIVTGYVGSKPPRYVLRAVREGQIGGVILFSNNMPTTRSAKRAIDRLQRAAELAGRPPLLVMIDQEGGIVQRLPQIPPTRTPASMGRSSDPARTAGAQGLATGKALSRLGFNVNLAPVVDVPRVRNSFLGNRAYSRSSSVVAAATCAFAEGNERGGVAATFKHFPGLGRAGADTDFNDVTIDANRMQLRGELKPYRTCANAPSLVMMSSARYPNLGAYKPGSLSRNTYSLLRETGFRGLTITDALETPQYGRRANTGRSALLAGADILLWGQAWRRAMDSRKRMMRDVASGVLERDRLVSGTEKVVALKQRFGY